jgi:hypothetical protein
LIVAGRALPDRRSLLLSVGATLDWSRLLLAIRTLLRWTALIITRSALLHLRWLTTMRRGLLLYRSLTWRLRHLHRRPYARAGIGLNVRVLGPDDTIKCRQRADQ